MAILSTPDYDGARQELVGWLETARAAATSALGWTVLLDADNRGLIDLASSDAVRPHLAYEIIWRPGYQASLGLQPVIRQPGQFVISAKVKVGSGTADLLKLAGKLPPYLQVKSGSYVQTLEAELQDYKDSEGWRYQPLLVNFWMDYIHTAA